jgi:multidrug efflux pump subunit AcrA (membrane-fusion protein)
LRIRFEVPEQDVPGIAAGTQVRVVTKASPEGLPAKVSGIGSEVSRERRVATAEAVIENPPAGWLPGMYADAVVDRRTLANATLVPEAAVLSRLQPSGQIVTGVFVDHAGVAKWVAVIVVARDDKRVAIEGAIGEHARVLVGGHVDLMDGGHIKVTR